MVKLYTFSKKKGSWVFADLGMKRHASYYARQGYVVVFI